MRKQTIFYTSCLSGVWMLLCVLFSSRASAQEYWVVVNQNNPLAELSVLEVRSIFLGVRRVFNSGYEIEVVDQSIESAVYAGFYKRVAGKTVAQIRAKRAYLTFAGDALPPEAVMDDQAVITWIEQHQYGIGYVRGDLAGTMINRVKVVSRISDKFTAK
jgi:ABC-type phosphate transport system substrate-binding protein